MNIFLLALFAVTLVGESNSHGSIDHDENASRSLRKASLNTWRRPGRPSDLQEVLKVESRDPKGGRAIGESGVFGEGRSLVGGLLRTLGGRGSSGSSGSSGGRFLDLFELVNFENVECVSSSGIRGVCVHAFECASSMGQEVDVCADGYGVCCKFEHTCGEQSRSNRTTFTNPSFPNQNDDRLACTLTLHKMHPQIVQLRVEIVQMELQPPTNGTCVDDQFVITGQNLNNIIPILCGINNGQHVYVEVDEASGPFYISVLSASEASRIFQIEIYQIEAGSRSSAPPGCLQYYVETEGEFESFNYQIQSNLISFRSPSYFNHMNYAICIKRAANTCSITYSTFSDDKEHQFQILNYDSDGTPIIPPGQAGAEIFNCPDDFIIVNGIRLCGERLNDASVSEDFTVNAPVTELGGGPILFAFRTNGNVTGRGFHLFYRQNNCFASRTR